MSYNFSIAEDNILKNQLHNLKDTSNPTLFSYILFGDESMLCFPEVVLPWDWQTMCIISLGLHTLRQNKY